MTKSPRNVPDVGIELGAACLPSRLTSDRVTAPGPCICLKKIFVSYIHITYIYVCVYLVLFPVFKNEAIFKNWATTWHNPQSAQQRHRSAWSESSLSAWRSIGSLATHWVHREDWSDWVNKLYWRKLISHDLSHDWLVLLYCPKADVMTYHMTFHMTLTCFVILP